VLHEDQRLITEVEEREAEVQDKLDRLHRKEDELAHLKSEKEDQRRQYEALKAQRGHDLATVRNQKTENEAAARELEAAAARMEKVLAELERKRRAAMTRHSPLLAELDRNDFGKNRGRLPWPVQGEIIDAFGRHEHPKYHTITLNNGVDIAADIGTPVISVGDGVVDLVQWLPGYGQTVIVNHGRGFYTIYAHLSAVSVVQGARVAPGQTLGAVGDTGSLKGACLHFEVRNGGSAENPTGWLR
jgi:septal ring factor EnvC (AmiA/AmiB activator)